VQPDRARGRQIEVEVDKFLRRETGRRHQDFAILLGTGRSGSPASPWCCSRRLRFSRPSMSGGPGVAAVTVNHRRGALRSLFRRLDPDSPNPVDRTRPFKEPEPEPRAVPRTCSSGCSGHAGVVTKPARDHRAHRDASLRVDAGPPDDLTLLEALRGHGALRQGGRHGSSP